MFGRVIITDHTLRHFANTTLPTNVNVLRRLVHLHSVTQLTIDNSIDIVADEIISIWQKLCVTTKRKDHVKTAVRKLNNDYKLLMKSKTRRTPAQIQRETSFQQKFPVLFDIAHKGIISFI